LGQLGTAWDSLGQLGTAWDSLGQLGTAWDSLGQAFFKSFLYFYIFIFLKKNL
jgi:hypothetical protein